MKASFASGGARFAKTGIYLSWLMSVALGAGLYAVLGKADMFTAYYGEPDAMPPEVFEAVQMLRHNKVDRFRFDDENEHSFHYFSLATGAYPARLVTNSPYRLTFSPKPEGKNCMLVERNGNALLYRCGKTP